MSRAASIPIFNELIFQAYHHRSHGPVVHVGGQRRRLLVLQDIIRYKASSLFGETSVLITFAGIDGRRFPFIL